MVHARDKARMISCGMPAFDPESSAPRSGKSGPSPASREPDFPQVRSPRSEGSSAFIPSGAEIPSQVRSPGSKYRHSPRDPVWPEIEQRYQAGRSLTNCWIAYRATAAKPYSYNRFILRRKAWLAAGKPEALAKPNTPAKPQRAPLAPIEVTGGLAHIDAPGTALQVRAGALAIRFADGTERHFRPGEHRLETIVLAGRGASVTSEAVRWLLAESVALLIADRNGEGFGLFAVLPLLDTSRNALALRRKQFAADLVRVAKGIVACKIAASELEPGIARTLTTKLRNAKTVMDARAIEAKAATAFFRKYQGAEIKFKGSVPDSWHVFQTRMIARRGGKLGEKGSQFSARDATTPCNAAINYGLAVALSRITRVLISRGLDPACGFLHADKPGRLSLSYDALELIRPKVTDIVMQWAAARTFKKENFATFEHGIVRLSSETAREVAARVLKAIPIKEYDEAMRAIVAML